MMKSSLLGLAVHDIPLIRDFYPQTGEVNNVQGLVPFGYALNLSHQDAQVVMTAFMPGRWPARWCLSAVGRDCTLEVEFTPSYVLGGSCRARLISRHSELTYHFEENGYQVLWRTIHDVLSGVGAKPISNETVLDDFEFALDLVDASHSLMDGRS
jgi:hypothetical protein